MLLKRTVKDPECVSDIGEDSTIARCDGIVEVWALKHYLRCGLRNASAGAIRISFLTPFHKLCYDRQLPSDHLQYRAHVAVQHFIERPSWEGH